MRKKVFITGTVIALVLLIASSTAFAQGLSLSQEEAHAIKTEIKEGKSVREVLERHHITMGQIRSALTQAGFQHGNHKLSNTQIASIASKLGLDIDRVQEEIEDGKTLYQILDDHNITKEEIRAAFQEEMKSKSQFYKDFKKDRDSRYNKKHR